jgi:hypothetical protein
MRNEPLGMWLYGAYGVPWRKDSRDEQLKATTKVEYDTLIGATVRGGGVPRWNGSLYYPAKIPDLIGIKDRKYIDHTATHLHRGIGDLMRYAALVSFAETADYGPHHISRNQRSGFRRDCRMKRCTRSPRISTRFGRRRIRIRSTNERWQDRRSSRARDAPGVTRLRYTRATDLLLRRVLLHHRMRRRRWTF